MSAPTAPPTAAHPGATPTGTPTGGAWPAVADDLCLRVGALVLVTDLAIVVLRVLS